MKHRILKGLMAFGMVLVGGLSAQAQQFAWNNLVGNPGGSGSGDGSGARFNYPNSVAVDAGGTVYVADSGNNTIRKITPGGVVSTLAGMPGVSGTADGTGASAQFNFPCGIAVDASGNVYVADTFNQTIRKVTSGGVVTTLSGSASTIGSSDGTASAAHFNFPGGIAVDSSGNVYVADTNNHSIRKEAWTVVTTLAGSAFKPGISGYSPFLNNPTGIAVDAGGTIYMTDTRNHMILKCPYLGSPSIIAGGNLFPGKTDGAGSSSPGGYGTACFFNFPGGIAGGTLFVVDTNNQRIFQGSVMQPPVITSALTSTGTDGFVFNYTITAGNAPTSFNATGPATGLNINPLTGLISGTPTVSGTFSLGISASNIAGTGIATLTLSLLPTPYQAWQGVVFSPNQQANPALSSDLATPAGDGISNLMKYALHLNPLTNGVSGLPVESSVNISSSNYLTLTYTKVLAATDLTYTVQISTDLQTWNSGASYTTTTSATNNPDGITQSVTVQSLVPLSNGSPRQFIRLQVSH